MILFKEIYNKAINLFDDPDMQRAYYQGETIRWQKMMYDYFQNAIKLFTNPTNISILLDDQTPPYGVMETFISTGEKTVTLESNVPENADFKFAIDKIVDQNAIYNRDNNTVTFNNETPVGAVLSVEWYFCGCFNSDFKSAATSVISSSAIENRVKDILTRALILSWAENEKNFALDIRNILTDTDFKLYSPANSIKSKVEWVKQLRFDFDAMQTKLGWNLHSRKYTGGKYYG